MEIYKAHEDERFGVVLADYMSVMGVEAAEVCV
jgi:hypothetical protein